MSKKSLIDKAKKIPSQLYQGFEHGAYEVNNQITGLEQAIFDKLGIGDEEKKKRSLESIRKSAEYQKELEKTMGTLGKVASFSTEMIPSALVGLNPLGATAMGLSMTAGDTAQQQLKEHGEINPDSSFRSGVLSGVLDAGASALTRGLSRRIPYDVDVLGRASASNMTSNQISDVMTDSMGEQGAFAPEQWEYLVAELERRKKNPGAFY